jgi:hypothetical protein
MRSSNWKYDSRLAGGGVAGAVGWPGTVPDFSVVCKPVQAVKATIAAVKKAMRTVGCMGNVISG